MTDSRSLRMIFDRNRQAAPNHPPSALNRDREYSGALSRVVSAYHAFQRECIEGDDPDEQVRAATRLRHRVQEAETMLAESASTATPEPLLAEADKGQDSATEGKDDA